MFGCLLKTLNKCIMKSFCFILSFLITLSTYAHEQYLGLGLQLQRDTLLRSRAVVCQDTLFVTSPLGLYCKALNDLNDTVWQCHSFEHLPVLDFYKKKDTLIVLIDRPDSSLLFSTDNGRSYVAANVSSHRGGIYRSFAVNPHNTSNIYYDAFVTRDFGASWNELPVEVLTVLGVNPNDTSNVFTCASVPCTFCIPPPFDLTASYDAGLTWTIAPFTHFYSPFSRIIFHPTDPDILLRSQYHWILKSKDRGQSWYFVSNDDTWSRHRSWRMVYDSMHASVLYAVADSMLIRSVDEGETWDFLAAHSGISVSDVDVFDSLLLITSLSGVFALDLNHVSSLNPVLNETDCVVQASAKSLYYSGRVMVRRITLIDLSGRVCSVAHPNSVCGEMDVSNLISGVYVVQLQTDLGCVNRKIYK